MLKNIITRPVLATVISILLVILGIVGIRSLPVTKFPDIAPPSVVVTATYPGASAEVIGRSVAPPLEEAINGVENMTYMTSTSSNDGSLMITVYFKLGTDPDQAAVNVQNRVSQATSQLPQEVLQIGVTTLKQQSGITSVISLYSDNDSFDETFIQNYAKINIVPELKRITGVGQAMVIGNKDYSMRIWLNPQVMASYNITPAEVAAAIRDQNLEAAPGRFGQSSREAMEYVIKYKGKLSRPEEYENMIIRSDADGSVLRLKDLARVEFGAYNYTVSSAYSKKPAVSVIMFQSAGSNANAVETGIRTKMAELLQSFPNGLKYDIPYSSKESLDESIGQVIQTLIEAFILVFFVVYVFLQDFRSTLIPAIAVPVSIIGTFFFMNLFGFSINLLTLFALVLAIGIVVDDAIVVVEAVHAKMERTHWPALKATAKTMDEITGAIITITLVMSAVFLPVGFIEGPTGVFYQQFAFTLAIAIIISAVNALTLSPALCALFLSNAHANTGEKKGSFKDRFFKGFNAGFSRLAQRYGGSILFFTKNRTVSFIGMVLIFCLLGWMFIKTPTGFIPDEDQGFLIVSGTLPPGASFNRTVTALSKAESELEKLPYVKTILSISGFNLLSFSTSPSSGVLMIRLKDRRDRGEMKDINQIVAQMQGVVSRFSEASFFVLSMPTVPGFGTTSGLEIVLQDRTSGSLEKFSQVAGGVIAGLQQRPEISFAFTTFRADYPQYEMVVDEQKAKQLGVNISELVGVMQGFYGGTQASDFNRFGKYYRVVMQADADNRKEVSSVDGVFVKNNAGKMVPVNTLISLKRVFGPETVEHFNLFNSIAVTATVAPGYSTGEALEALKEVSAKTMPAGYTYDLKGMSREERQASGQSGFIIALCIVFVYFLLAAQYESYILPLSVILSIPAGLMGVFVGVKAGGLSNNIYVQVAMVMLIGLLAKNAILIVEFARQRRIAGKSLLSAAVDGARARLRPILMTSFAFIAGLLPLLRAVGPSALGNHSIGYAAVFGMLVGTILGIFISPVLFVLFQYLQEKFSGKPQSENTEVLTN